MSYQPIYEWSQGDLKAEAWSNACAAALLFVFGTWSMLFLVQGLGATIPLAVWCKTTIAVFLVTAAVARILHPVPTREELDRMRERDRRCLPALTPRFPEAEPKQ